MGSGRRSQSPTAARPQLLFLNRSYWPDVEATGQLLTELCEDLAASFDVTVVSGRPNTNLAGAKRLAKTTLRNGVAIRQVGHTTFSKRHWWGRAVNWLTYLAAAFFTALRAPRPTVVVVETDPPLLCLAGWFLAKWRRCRFVVYLQDIYPDVAVALRGLPEGWIAKILRRLFLAAYGAADRVVVLSRDMKDFLVQSGMSARRIAIIPNWVDARAVHPIKEDNPFRRRYELENRFVVMYSGNLGFAQRLENVLDAAERLLDSPEIAFVLIGDGASRLRLEAAASEKKLSNVRFLGYQPKEDLAQSLSAADLHLIPLHPKVLPFLMPSKLYGILASGTAVCVTAPAGSELAETVVQNDVGIVAPPDDSAALADAVRWALSHRAELARMGERGHRLVLTDFDRPIATARFALMLNQVVGRPEPAERPLSTPASRLKHQTA